MSDLELRLTQDQAEQFAPLLEIQRQHEKAGIFAVVGMSWCSETGEPMVKLHCKLADWNVAKKVCKILIS